MFVYQSVPQLQTQTRLWMRSPRHLEIRCRGPCCVGGVQDVAWVGLRERAKFPAGARNDHDRKSWGAGDRVGGFQLVMGVPLYRWMVFVNGKTPLKWNLGVPLFQETPKSRKISVGSGKYGRSTAVIRGDSGMFAPCGFHLGWVFIHCLPHIQWDNYIILNTYISFFPHCSQVYGWVKINQQKIPQENRNNKACRDQVPARSSNLGKHQKTMQPNVHVLHGQILSTCHAQPLFSIHKKGPFESTFVLHGGWMAVCPIVPALHNHRAAPCGESIPRTTAGALEVPVWYVLRNVRLGKPCPVEWHGRRGWCWLHFFDWLCGRPLISGLGVYTLLSRPKRSAGWWLQLWCYHSVLWLSVARAFADESITCLQEL